MSAERVVVRKTERGPWEVLVDRQLVSTHTTSDAARITAQRHVAILLGEGTTDGEK